MQSDPEKTHHKPRFFSYNDTDEYRRSLNATWGPCFDFSGPSPDSIFVKARENHCPHKQQGIQSAREAWSQCMPTTDSHPEKPSIFTADANDFSRPVSYVNIPKPVPFMGAFSHLEENPSSTPNVQTWERPHSFLTERVPSVAAQPEQDSFLGVGSISAIPGIEPLKSKKGGGK